MRISTNVQSMVAQRFVKGHTEDNISEEMKLSSGSRIVRSADDPAGLAISESMKAKIRSNYQAERNTNDAVSLLQVAEGSLTVMHDMGARLRELAMQAATDTVSDVDRVVVDKEFQQLKAEIKRLTVSTTFNGNHIITGQDRPYDLQIGINGSSSENQIKYDMNKVMDSSHNFGIESVDLKSKYSAQNSLSAIDKMIGEISGSRAELGSMSNRMNSVIQNLQVSRENLSSSNSKIRDADVALESGKQIQAKLAESASLAMLKISNDQPGMVLKLIGS